MPTAVVSEGKGTITDVNDLAGCQTTREFRQRAKEIMLKCRDVHHARIKIDQIIAEARSFARDNPELFQETIQRSNFQALFYHVSGRLRNPKNATTWTQTVSRYLGKSGMRNFHRDIKRRQ